MGNQQHKEHDVGRQAGSGGIGCNWKIYDATRRASGEAVSLFVFDKRALGREGADAAAAFAALLRHDAHTALRLRHPAVLRVLRPPVETRTDIVMETERVCMSLRNALRGYANLSAVPQDLKSHTWTELEKSHCLLNIAEALHFLHGTAHVTHTALAPEAVFLTATGRWVVGGFAFAVHANYEPGPGAPGAPPHRVFQHREFTVNDAFCLQPPLDYLAPECVFKHQVAHAGDLFSLGCVAYELFNEKKLLECSQNALTYKGLIEQLVPFDVCRVPPRLQEPLRGLLRVNPCDRLTLPGFLASEFFAGIELRALAYIGHIASKQEGDKAVFYRGLADVIPNFSEKILLGQVFSAVREDVKFESLAPFLLQVVFKAADGLTPEGKRHASALLCAILRAHHMSADMLARALQPWWPQCVALTPADQTDDLVLPLLLHGLAAADALVVDRTVRALPHILPLLPHSHTPPVAAQLCALADRAPAHRVNVLVCLGKLAGHFGALCVRERVLPLLLALIARCGEGPPRASEKVLATVLNVLAHILPQLTDECALMVVVPALLPLYAAPPPALTPALFGRCAAIVTRVVEGARERTAAVLEKRQQLTALAADPASTVEEWPIRRRL